MAVYFVTGKLGCGKTLCTVGKIRDYLEQGRRVATNLDIYLDAMTKPDSRLSITRVPDKPRVDDLQAIGLGCSESDESKYGLLVLDELGTWFNSRNWRDKDRGDVIDWFRHARKLHWDIFLIVQDLESLDGQLVNALCEHLVVCKRTDRLTLPFIGPIFKSLGLQAVFPKIHVAKVYYGQNESAMAVDRWWYRGKDLYPAYNTDQIFDEQSHAVHSVLPAYYINNIALIEHHQAQVKCLTPVDKRPASKSSGYKTVSVMLFSVVVLALSYRTYAKINDFNSKSIPTIIQPVSTSKPEAKVEVLPAVIVQPVPVIQPDDYIKSVTFNKTITASSYYSAEGRINAVLHSEKDQEGQTSTFTLDDARAAGYVVILHGNIVEVRRSGYYFTFRISTDLTHS